MATQVQVQILDTNVFPEAMLSIPGIQATTMTLNNSRVENSDVVTGVWQTLLNDAGRAQLSLTFSGIYVKGTAHNLLQEQAFANVAQAYEITFPDGDMISGDFQISSYGRSAQQVEEETFSLSLESTGEITYTQAS